MFFPSGAQRASRRALARHLAGLVLLAASLGVGAAVAEPVPVAAVAGPKVAIIVGPSGTQTATNRDWASAAAKEALRYTTNVVKVSSPNATWSKVKAAISGAAIVVYIGRGRGFPSPYSSTLKISTEDGFGLNPVAGVNNSTTKYYGESYVRTLRLAPGAVVLLHHLAYASGNSEPGRTQPTLLVARRRVDNYGAGFLAAGASAVIAEAYSTPTYYIRSIFTRDASLDTVWRTAPTYHRHVTSFTSARTRGAVGRTDPLYATSGYYRSIVGWTATRTTAVRAGSSPGSTPVPPAATGVYGTAINADTKAHLQVGGVDSGQPNAKVAHRFRAGTTSALNSVRFAQRGGTGYSGGSGGSMRISVQADRGGVPSGAALSSVTFAPGNPAGGWSTFARVTFPSPATLTKGGIYYIVFENVDPAPTVNYISVNELFVYENVLSPRQPAFSDADYAVLDTGRGSWAVEGRYTGVMDLTYANGWHDGLGYYEAMIAHYGVVSGPSNMVREHFTVSGGNRTVTTASVRVRRTSGTSPLTVRLETAAGSLIEAVDIPSSAIPVSAPGGDNGGAVWVTASFSSAHVLSNGASYNLRLSTAAGTAYTTFPLREGADLGFGSYAFTDGSGQHTTNGSTWTDLYLWSPQDLQFFFR